MDYKIQLISLQIIIIKWQPAKVQIKEYLIQNVSKNFKQIAQLFHKNIWHVS